MATRGKIFISYRRDDAPGDARGIRDRLASKFGKANVFMDVDNLLAGQRFDRELEKALSQCDVLIAVIGPRWMKLLSAHTRSGDRDYVHDEIAAALERDITVIPTLVGRKGHMPSLPHQDSLAEDIRALVLHHKQDIAHESFSRDADELVEAVKAVLRGKHGARPWRPMTAAGAIGLVSAAALFGYWMDVIPGVGPSPGTFQSRSGGDREAKAAEQSKKAAADEVAKKAAAEEAAKKVAEDAQRQADAEVAQKKKAAEEARRKVEADAAEAARRKAEAERAVRPPRPGTPGESCARNGYETYCVSSVLKPQFGNSYGPENLFAGPESVAWVEGQPGQGIGEWIAIEFESMRTVRSIVVRNGYQKSDDIFQKNNRVRQLRALFSQGEIQTLILQDRFGSELLTFSKPIQAYWVKFVIDEVWAGNKYTDTAITKLLVNSERVK